MFVQMRFVDFGFVGVSVDEPNSLGFRIVNEVGGNAVGSRCSCFGSKTNTDRRKGLDNHRSNDHFLCLAAVVIDES